MTTSSSSSAPPATWRRASSSRASCGSRRAGSCRPSTGSSGSSPLELSDDEFRDHARDVVNRFGRVSVADPAWDRFIRRLSYVQSDADHMQQLAAAVQRRVRGARGRHPRPLLPLDPAGGHGQHRCGPRRVGSGLGPDQRDPREALRHRRRLGSSPRRRAPQRPRRGADLPDRPLPGEGGRAEHPRDPLRQPAVRAHVEHAITSRASRSTCPRRSGSRTGRRSTRRRVRSATWWSRTCSRRWDSWRWSRRTRSVPTRSQPRSSGCSTRCSRSTPLRWFVASTRGTATSPRSPTTPTPRRWWRSGSRSTTSDGPGCRSSCGRGSGCPRVAGSSPCGCSIHRCTCSPTRCCTPATSWSSRSASPAASASTS